MRFIPTSIAFLIDRLMVWDTGMYNVMFDLDRRYNRPFVAPIVAPIVLLIHTKHIHSSVSYQWAIYKKKEKDRRRCESLSGYGA